MKKTEVLSSKNEYLFPTWLSIAIFTLIGLLSASQLYSFFRVKEDYITYINAVLIQVPGWVLWGLLSPLIWRSGSRYKLERHSYIRNLIIQVIIFTFFAMSHLAFIAANRLLWDKDVQGKTTFLRFYLFTALNNFHFELFLYLAVLILGYAFDFYRRYNLEKLANSKLQQKLTIAQLETLKTQLNPHFLFNTLNSISMLVRKNNGQAAIDMLSGLAELLRYTLRENHIQQVNLKQELDFIGKYLAIEQIRFQDRLKVVVDVSEEAMIVNIPNMILQPLIENAVKHGIVKYANSGLIKIKAFCKNNMLFIQIEDDGIGLSEDWEEKIGIGISNTRSRLDQIYDGRYSLTLNCCQPHGTQVKLSIPIMLSKN